MQIYVFHTSSSLSSSTLIVFRANWTRSPRLRERKEEKKKRRKIHIWTLLRTLMQREAVQSRSPIDDVWLHRVWPFILEADGLLLAGDHNFWSEPHCINTERWILMDECKHWISSITKFAVLAYVEDFGNFEIIVTYFVKRLW